MGAWLARKLGITKPPPWSYRKRTSVAPVACSMAPKAPGEALDDAVGEAVGEADGEADGGAADGGALAPGATPVQAMARTTIGASAAGGTRSDIPPGRTAPSTGSPTGK